MAELVTVVIPVYNVEKYLPKCVNSVLQQSYTNLEIILVDDGSPDRCGTICDEFACRDERVKVIHQKNKGLSGARNSAIDICTGEYITFLDSDDWLELNAIEVLLQLAHEYNAEIVGTSLLDVYDSGNTKNNGSSGITVGKKCLKC